MEPTTDAPTAARATLSRAMSSFRATPAESIGLAVLLVGSLVASAALWVGATQRPDAAGAVLATDGRVATWDTSGPTPSEWGHPAPGGVGDLPEADRSTGGDTEGALDAGGLPGPSSTMTVHVTGAVAVPGIVTVPGGSRVADVVAGAGGLVADADVSRINLARTVGDGEHVHVPAAGEELSMPSGEAFPATTSGSAPDTVTGGRIDLNRATAEQLQTLPGIGPSRSAAIIRHRDEHGPFQVPGDVRRVPGIGEAIFQGMADLIGVG
jgi:competence protein ComEA